MRLPSLQQAFQPLPQSPSYHKVQEMNRIKLKKKFDGIKEIAGHYSSLNVVVDREVKPLTSLQIKES